MGWERLTNGDLLRPPEDAGFASIQAPTKIFAPAKSSRAKNLGHSVERLHQMVACAPSF
jgi:hypothetical protein